MTPVQRLIANPIFILAVGLIVTAPASRAVVIRHDVPEEQYLKLAADPALQASIVAVLDPRGSCSGVLLDAQHILTVGHPIEGYLAENTTEGPIQLPVRVRGEDFTAEYAYIHPQYDPIKNRGGADLAILRLSQAVPNFGGSVIWSGVVNPGLAFVGVGQGKSGTGKDRNEPLPRGTFRGYENVLDFIHSDDYSLFRSDFDDDTPAHNTLSRVVYDRTNTLIKGASDAKPLPLEGTAAGGDSGSGVWLRRDGKHYLLGIATYRFFSMYGGQSAYVNLSHPVHVQWLKSVATAEATTFGFKSN